MLTTETVAPKTLIADYLRQRFPALADRPLDAATPLLAGGVVDSLGILDLATFLAERFGIEISDDDFEPRNFETFGALVAFVEGKRV